VEFNRRSLQLDDAISFAHPAATDDAQPAVRHAVTWMDEIAYVANTGYSCGRWRRSSPDRFLAWKASPASRTRVLSRRPNRGFLRERSHAEEDCVEAAPP
jgi:hypothetical protein